MWDNDLVEAGGPGDETIHLRPNRGDRSVVNTPKESFGQDSLGEALHDEVVGGAVFKEGR